MKIEPKIRNASLLMLSLISLSACGNIQTVKSFSTQYQEPQTGPRAKLRVVAYGGMVRAVPNSDCVDWRLPGAGVMVASDSGFAHVNSRKLDMPPGRMSGVPTASGVVAVSELYVPAGVPLVLDFLSGGAKSAGSHYQCFVRKAFTPSANENYEAVFTQDASVCRFGVMKISHDAGNADTQGVDLRETKFCRASDNI